MIMTKKFLVIIVLNEHLKHYERTVWEIKIWFTKD